MVAAMGLVLALHSRGDRDGVANMCRGDEHWSGTVGRCICAMVQKVEDGGVAMSASGMQVVRCRDGKW